MNKSQNSSIRHLISINVHALGSGSAVSRIYPTKVIGQMHKDAWARIVKAVVIF